MFQALLITFREGLESFLIVGVIAAYLRKTGRAELVRGVGIGLLASTLLSVAGALLWWKARESGDDVNEALYEAIGAFVAAALVGVLLWQMQRIGRHLKSDIETRIQKAVGSSDRSPRLAILAVAVVTTIFVTREMAEALLVLGARAMSTSGRSLVAGSVLGLAAAAGYAWLWSRHGKNLRLGLVLRATAVFLALFLVQLIVYGVHELAESGIIAGSEAFHDATERLGPDGDIGQIFAFIVGSVPLLAAAAGIVQMLMARRTTQPATARAAE